MAEAPVALFVVLPVHDEEEAIVSVAHEWLAVLRRETPDFEVYCIDDGSTDATPKLLDALAEAHAEISVRHQANAGHGESCRRGYAAALAGGAPWILQIDSDGQCDPADFAALWRHRTEAPVHYGRRRRRADGLARAAVSRLLGAAVRAATGRRVCDPNVPFRLMSRDALARTLADVPAGFGLVNVALAVLQQERVGICWHDIGFRERSGGRAALRPLGFARAGLRVFGELRALRRGTQP